MPDRLFAFVAAVGFITAPILVVLRLMNQRERREDRIYASLACLPLAEEWRGRLAATVRCSLLTRRCDVSVLACLPSTLELADVIASVRRVVPRAARVTLDVVTPQEGRLIVVFVGSGSASHAERLAARPSLAPPVLEREPGGADHHDDSIVQAVRGHSSTHLPSSPRNGSGAAVPDGRRASVE